MVKLFVTNITTDISYILNKYQQYKLVWKLLGVCWCLHLHFVNTLYRLDGNETCLKNYRAFSGPELNLSNLVLILQFHFYVFSESHRSQRKGWCSHGWYLLLLASYGRSRNFTGLNVYTFTIDLLLIIYIIVTFVIRKPLILFTMLSPKIKTNVFLLFLLLALLLLLLLALLLSLSLFAWLVFTIFHCN